MITVDDIHEYKEYLVKDLYSKVREEQRKDLAYIDDTFPVSEIREPHKIYRSGIGARMVNAPAEQIVTSNPQVYVEILKGAKEVSTRISPMFNGWIDIMRRGSPNPFKEIVKNKLGRGESFIQLAHNERWVMKPIGKDKDEFPIFDRRGLPVLFLTPDPMVVYASPEEDDCGWEPNSGVPNRVIVFYERQPLDVILRYPRWSNPKDAGKGDNKNKKVEWLAYYDRNVIYFEADGEPVLSGIKDNLYGFTPFIRKYSGFGRRSPDGDLSKLIVSDIRMSRDLILEECITRSNIASILHLHAHRPYIITSEGEINEEDIRENLSLGASDLSILSNLPGNTKVDVQEIPQPSAETFQHLRDKRAEIAQRSPFIMAGFPLGTSGRQQDISSLAAMSRYDTVIENTELEYATALEMAFKILSAVPTLKPEGLHKNDLDANIKCEVKLKETDPIEKDRLVTLGDRLWARGQGSIDLRTNLTQFQGRTEEEAEDIIADILVDKMTLYNPDVASVMGMIFAEESGMKRWLEQAQEKRKTMEGGLQPPAPRTTEERMMGETETPLGEEMGTEPNRGARTPPGRFTRR